MSLRDQILAVKDIATESVKVPEWGLTVEVRGMTAAERTRIMNLAMKDGGDLDLQMVYPEIVIATAFDPETGMQVFDPSDRDALLGKAATAVDRIALAGMRLSGFTKEAADEAGKDSSEPDTEGSSSS